MMQKWTEDEKWPWWPFFIFVSFSTHFSCSFFIAASNSDRTTADTTPPPILVVVVAPAAATTLNLVVVVTASAISTSISCSFAVQLRRATTALRRTKKIDTSLNITNTTLSPPLALAPFIEHHNHVHHVIPLCYSPYCWFIYLSLVVLYLPTLARVSRRLLNCNSIFCYLMLWMES